MALSTIWRSWATIDRERPEEEARASGRGSSGRQKRGSRSAFDSRLVLEDVIRL